MKRTMPIYAFVEDGLADLGHEWWYSATSPR
jgi:hypothetical protein